MSRNDRFYTVSQKTLTEYYASQLSQMWTNANNSFIIAFSDEAQIKVVYDALVDLIPSSSALRLRMRQ